MPLSDGPLLLEASPQSVSVARAWVVDTLQRLGRDDVTEAAALGISELVTNALLHAAPPFRVQLRGTPQHPRVEVHDSSARPIVPPSQSAFDTGALVDLDDGSELDDEALDRILTTFGRGLALVAMASTAWGATMEAQHKVVWFEPAPEIAEQAGPEPVLEFESVPAARPLPADPVTVRWYGMDPLAFSAQRRQYFGLRRELRLLALAHGEEYPLALEMGEAFTDFEQHFPAEEFTVFTDDGTPGGPLVNVSLPMARDAVHVCARMLTLFELADEFCQQQRLLSLARTAMVAAFQRWFITEAIEQIAGRAPTAWAPPSAPLTQPG